jgi:hypothetical protein
VQKTCENLSAQFHTRVGKMIGSNTDDGGSKSNELEFLLWSWLGDDSIFSQGSKSYDEVLQGPFLKEDKNVAEELRAIVLQFAPLLARMRSRLVMISRSTALHVYCPFPSPTNSVFQQKERAQQRATESACHMRRSIHACEGDRERLFCLRVILTCTSMRSN